MRISVRRVRNAVRFFTTLSFALAAYASPAFATGERNCDDKVPGKTESISNYHNPGLAKAADTIVCFDGYISDFSFNEDIDGDEEPDKLGAPHFVSYRVDKADEKPASG